MNIFDRSYIPSEKGQTTYLNVQNTKHIWVDSLADAARTLTVIFIAKSSTYYFNSLLDSLKLVLTVYSSSDATEIEWF